MRYVVWPGAVICLCAFIEPAGASQQLQIPSSIKTEHQAIHASLVEATNVPGAVGAAARELADVLHPHFVREEIMALPQLGVLSALATGAVIPEPVLAEVLKLSDSMREELPRMLQEHKAIRAAVQKLAQVAKAEKAAKHEQFAHALALHAETEEQVLYPAAVLVAEVIRARARR